MPVELLDHGGINAGVTQTPCSPDVDDWMTMWTDHDRPRNYRQRWLTRVDRQRRCVYRHASSKLLTVPVQCRNVTCTLTQSLKVFTHTTTYQHEHHPAI